jgi:hypothetical protein
LEVEIGSNSVMVWAVGGGVMGVITAIALLGCLCWRQRQGWGSADSPTFEQPSSSGDKEFSSSNSTLSDIEWQSRENDGSSNSRSQSSLLNRSVSESSGRVLELRTPSHSPHKIRGQTVTKADGTPNTSPQTAYLSYLSGPFFKENNGAHQPTTNYLVQGLAQALYNSESHVNTSIRPSDLEGLNNSVQLAPLRQVTVQNVGASPEQATGNASPTTRMPATNADKVTLWPGAVVGSYRCISFVGSGASSNCYLVEDVNTGQFFATKVRPYCPL